jgi:23S rRNA (cytosine1962-C5)-methyltransferase
MRTTGWADYALIDSGGGRKLERYGATRWCGPEPQCLWTPRLPPARWDAADAVFDPTDEDDGRWRFSDSRGDLAAGLGPVRFHGRFTNFRHLAFFPSRPRTGRGCQAPCGRPAARARPGAEPVRLYRASPAW